MTPDPITSLVRVATALESLGLSYCIGGSFASSIYGLPRSTNDVDLVVALHAERVAPLVATLENVFMFDPQAVGTAVATRRAFSIIDSETLDKVDIFVMADMPWSYQQVQRRRRAPVSNEPDAPELFFASPEDVVLSKLVWFRQGDGISDQQWRDILSVLAVQASAIDWAYLRRWAADLEVSDLLNRAASESGQGDTLRLSHTGM